MFSSDEWRCHAMLRHPVVSHHMPLDWTLAKTTSEWKRRLFRRRRATPVLISLATATPVISFLVVFFCFVLSASRSSSCFALSARLERHRLVCHVKDHLERLWLELSKRLARIQVLESQLLRAVNTEIHLLHQIQTSWKSDMFTRQKRGKKTDLSNAVYRRAQYHLVCHGPEAACRLPLVPTILIQNGCHGGQVYHQHLCNNYLSLHAKFWLIFPCQLMLSKLILLFNLFPMKRE